MSNTLMNKMMVVIVGAGPAGLATAACLTTLSIPNIILEKEDCYAHLWKKRTYDRLKLHLAKEFCMLPHLPHSTLAPTYIAKNDFVRYLDDYVEKFSISIECMTRVESAFYNANTKSWRIRVTNTMTNEEREYEASFLVVATGENAEGFVPKIPGIERFSGEVMHSSGYKSGAKYEGKRILVVGCGNSGMEIAYDLCTFGAKTFIVIRNPFHVMTKEFIHLGMVLANYLPIRLIDILLFVLSLFYYGNLSKYGIVSPAKGPLTLKAKTGRSAVIDVGAVKKIKSGEIQVVKEMIEVRGNGIMFKDGKAYPFDAIIFATGYKSTANIWLHDEGWLFNEDGFPKERFPNHWKGKNGLYCAGFARRGLTGISIDAQNIAKDIEMIFKRSQQSQE